MTKRDEVAALMADIVARHAYNERHKKRVRKPALSHEEVRARSRIAKRKWRAKQPKREKLPATPAFLIQCEICKKWRTVIANVGHTIDYVEKRQPVCHPCAIRRAKTGKPLSLEHRKGIMKGLANYWEKRRNARQ